MICLPTKTIGCDSVIVQWLIANLQKNAQGADGFSSDTTQKFAHNLTSGSVCTYAVCKW